MTRQKTCYAVKDLSYIKKVSCQIALTEDEICSALPLLLPAVPVSQSRRPSSGCSGTWQQVRKISASDGLTGFRITVEIRPGLLKNGSPWLIAGDNFCGYAASSHQPETLWKHICQGSPVLFFDLLCLIFLNYSSECVDVNGKIDSLLNFVEMI